MGGLADASADGVGLERVGPVGQMEVVRLGRPEREHGDFIASVADVGIVRLGEKSTGRTGWNSKLLAAGHLGLEAYVLLA